MNEAYNTDSIPIAHQENLNDFYRWLDGFINFEKRPHKKNFSLEVIRYYATLFSNPQTTYKCIHIAGSKGKGSVAVMLSALLTEAGYKSGLYTSPHVNDFRERITENGRFFSDLAYLEAFRAVQESVMPHIDKETEPQPSWFELVTLTAFVLFRQERLDWAVFETGMGGRLDATNIIQPEITVLTPIELEHCEYLGHTIPLIAAEKAGIIKAGVPVFCSRQQPSALEVFKERAAALNAPFFYLPDFIETIEHRLTPQGREVTIRFSAAHPVGALFKRPLHTILPLFTPVQAENAALAAAAFKYLFPDMPEDLIESGLSKAWLPARFQLLSTKPLIVLDGAHTHNSIQTCADTFFSLLNNESGASIPYNDSTSVHSGTPPVSGTISAYSDTQSIPDAPPNAKPILVFACAADKDPAGFAPIFYGNIAYLYLTVPGSFKKGNLEKTVGAFTQVFENENSVVMEASEDFNAILKKAFTQSITENRPLLITGSFYLAAEAQRVYSAEGFQDRETQG
ncbi:bifunctional folylpolyglutamate synthase/dihydrofolate synthase [Treponema medium]|uniref:bifunctional folylpolyglutamate synthase/dihydrofolate synthase n=1 Tax=Treponema medium TaxID=58231 RepID=UPI0019818450|nr:folylpolyglutamate synthase/dihydrofolate synthase family protein [Treponema medium]QSH93358.1 bifunctional folylpolyglutamate synthase/dihydrofolate synthase [Treponema medium]